MVAARWRRRSFTPAVPFVVLSDFAEVLYKNTDFYAPEHERSILWNDADLAIQWPDVGTPILSAKDQAGKPLREAELFDYAAMDATDSAREQA